MFPVHDPEVNWHIHRYDGNDAGEKHRRDIKKQLKILMMRCACEILDQIDEDVIIDAVADESDITDHQKHINQDFDTQEHE